MAENGDRMSDEILAKYVYGARDSGKRGRGLPLPCLTFENTVRKSEDLLNVHVRDDDFRRDEKSIVGVGTFGALITPLGIRREA